MLKYQVWAKALGIKTLQGRCFLYGKSHFSLLTILNVKSYVHTVNSLHLIISYPFLQKDWKSYQISSKLIYLNCLNLDLGNWVKYLSRYFWRLHKHISGKPKIHPIKNMNWNIVSILHLLISHAVWEVSVKSHLAIN